MRGTHPPFPRDFEDVPSEQSVAPQRVYSPAPPAFTQPPPPAPSPAQQGLAPTSFAQHGHVPPPVAARQPTSPGTKWAIGLVIGVMALGLIVGGVILGREVSNLALIDSLDQGDCVQDHFRMAEDGEFFEVLFVSRADCSELHAYEVYAVASPWAGVEQFPGVDEAFSQGDEYCFEQFAEFVGQNHPSLPYEFLSFVPTAELWEDGHREVQCLVGHIDGETLVRGTLRNAEPQFTT